MVAIARCLAAALAVAGVNALPTVEPVEDSSLVARATFKEEFSSFNKDIWSCEYTCPVIEGGKARFRLKSGVPANQEGSWSKARYKPKRFTSGKFTVSFSLTARPKEKVWWGVALWDDGPSSSEFNEINFGYTVDGSLKNTQLLFESSKRGKYVSIPVDVGVNLYDESYHTATLEYNSSHVRLYFDGKMVKEVTDKSVIPTDAMDFILGPRLVRGNPLSAGFTESIDWVEIVY